jgi:hypothetical protein
MSWGGFGDDDVPPVGRLQEDEDEEILSDILHNAREFQNLLLADLIHSPITNRS